AEQERNRSYRAVVRLQDRSFRQLADEKLPDVNFFADGDWAVGQDDRPYRMLVGYDAAYSDYYLVNTCDGARQPMLRKQQGFPSFSPNGKYALFYDSKDWNTFSIPDGKVTNLTKNLGVPFGVEEYDSPSTPPPYGTAGWTKDDKSVLLYDRYDIW